MNGVVIYDSEYGNTEKVAEIIAKELGVAIVPVQEATTSVMDYDLLVVGSPTQGGRPTKPIQEFLGELDRDSLHNVYIAAFDTSFDATRQNIFLKMLMKVIGYAAPKISKSLVGVGGSLVAKPRSFMVADTKGPLIDGELHKAREWAAAIKRAAN